MIKLSAVPKNFTLKEEVYLLVGFINFKGSDIPEPGETGHYTAVSFRGNNWFEYDDQKEKPKILKQTSEAKPKILFYLKKQ